MCRFENFAQIDTYLPVLIEKCADSLKFIRLFHRISGGEGVIAFLVRDKLICLIRCSRPDKPVGALDLADHTFYSMNIR